MGKAEITGYERTLYDAQQAANEKRKEAGLPPMSRAWVPVERSPYGLRRRTGVDSYKTTLWWHPWSYVNLLRLQHRMGEASITKALERLVEEALPAKDRAIKPERKRKSEGKAKARHLKVAA